MGMYTGIRFKGYVKPQFRANFEPIAIMGRWDLSEDPIFKEFGDNPHASFIPCGALAYMPSSWETQLTPGDYNSFVDNDGFARAWNPETGYWTFQCSLKNYQREIEEFFDMIPYFIESIEDLEYYYEEWEASERYDFDTRHMNVVCVDKHYHSYSQGEVTDD